jgi:hypothetical protein
MKDNGVTYDPALWFETFRLLRSTLYGRISSPQEIEQALVFAIRLSLMIKIKKGLKAV